MRWAKTRQGRPLWPPLPGSDSRRDSMALRAVGADAFIGPNPPQAGLFAAGTVEIASRRTRDARPYGWCGYRGPAANRACGTGGHIGRPYGLRCVCRGRGGNCQRGWVAQAVEISAEKVLKRFRLGTIRQTLPGRYGMIPPADRAYPRSAERTDPRARDSAAAPAPPRCDHPPRFGPRCS